MSSADRKLVETHIEKLLEDAAEQKVPEDVVGRLLLSAVIGLWKKTRSIEDIVSELTFTIENLDPDAEYPFIRP